MTDHRTPDDPDEPSDEDGVEAYESDWYRSLQAISERAENKDASGDADGETDPDGERSEREGADPDARDEADEHDAAEKKRKAHEAGEPGIWVVVTPDR